jgi:deoxyhypusine synthase
LLHLGLLQRSRHYAGCNKASRQCGPTVVKAKLDQPGAQFKYAAINNGVATFGSAASDSVFGVTVGAHQVTNSWPIDIVKNGADTIGTIINPK